MMEMGNFRNAPFETLSFWSMKSGLAMQKARDYVDGDQVMPSSQMRFDMTEQAEVSPLLKVCVGQADTAHAHAYRHVRSLSRGSVEARGGDWIICREGGRSVVGRVAEMVELFLPSAAASLVRMLLSDAREVSFEDETRGHVIAVERDSPSGPHYVCAERASLHEVACDVRPDELVFSYIY
jgi:hypothetical protein